WRCWPAPSGTATTSWWTRPTARRSRSARKRRSASPPDRIRSSFLARIAIDTEEGWMDFKAFVRPAAAVALFFAGAASAHAQTWTGFYVGGQVGNGFLPSGDGAFVGFDKNLDGNFADTVTTAAGANAFSPGFCPGAS